ncbi:MAG TPA: hypothetical protein VH684_31370 [Xanthobacteraceae bacterium]
MTVDLYVADMAVRAIGGLLFVTFFCLLVGLLKQWVRDWFGAVDATGNGWASGAQYEASTTKRSGSAAYQNHAVGAAQHVIKRAGYRGNVRPEHVLFYDFVTAAARAVLADPAFAQTIGKQMQPIGSSQDSPPGKRPETAWLPVRSAVLISAAVLAIGFSVGWWSTLH